MKLHKKYQKHFPHEILAAAFHPKGYIILSFGSDKEAEECYMSLPWNKEEKWSLHGNSIRLFTGYYF